MTGICKHFQSSSVRVNFAALKTRCYSEGSRRTDLCHRLLCALSLALSLSLEYSVLSALWLWCCVTQNAVTNARERERESERDGESERARETERERERVRDNIPGAAIYTPLPWARVSHAPTRQNFYNFSSALPMVTRGSPGVVWLWLYKRFEVVSATSPVTLRFLGGRSEASGFSDSAVAILDRKWGEEGACLLVQPYAGQNIFMRPKCNN